MGQEVDFTIGSGADGSAVTPAFLGGTFEKLAVRCADCAGIAASTALSAQVKLASGDTICDLYTEDDPSTKWAPTALPETGTLSFVMNIPPSKHVRLILGNNATADVTFSIRGIA